MSGTIRLPARSVATRSCISERQPTDKRRNRFTHRRRQQDRRLAVEPLEDRTLLSVYYVDKPGDGIGPGGSDSSNNGTSVSTPYATIAKANSMVHAGDTVLIRGGTYTNDQIAPALGGSSGSRITYTNYNGEAVAVIGATSGSQAQKSGANLNGKSYIAILGLTFNDNGSTASDNSYRFIWVQNHSDHVEIGNCVFDGLLGLVPFTTTIWRSTTATISTSTTIHSRIPTWPRM